MACKPALQFGSVRGPVEDGVTDALHRPVGGLAGFAAALVEDLKNTLRIVLPFDSAFADRLDPMDEVVGHFGFAFDAADACGAATFCGPVEGFLGRKELVPVVDGADIGIAGVGAALAGGIGDHDFCFGPDVGVGFGQGDGVSVGL